MPQREVLRDHAFTHGLTEAQIEHLAGIATRVSFEENEVVLVDGARSTSFFLLLRDRKSTRLNSSHLGISYAVFCLKKNRPGRQTVPRLACRRLLHRKIGRAPV